MSSKRIYDVTMPLKPEMVTWPGDPPFSIEAISRIDRGDSSNVSLIHTGTHAGTHVDAPHHFVDGAGGVDTLSLGTLIGPARLFQFNDIEQIDRTTLSGLDLDGVTRLLLGTRNSALLEASDHTSDYVFLTDDGARYLVEKGVQLVGVDYLSIEKFKNPGHPTHLALLEAGVIIIEGLVLTGVPAGDYELLCLPMKIKDADGAPARVALRTL